MGIGDSPISSLHWGHGKWLPSLQIDKNSAAPKADVCVCDIMISIIISNVIFFVYAFVKFWELVA